MQIPDGTMAADGEYPGVEELKSESVVALAGEGRPITKNPATRAGSHHTSESTSAIHESANDIVHWGIELDPWLTGHSRMLLRLIRRMDSCVGLTFSLDMTWPFEHFESLLSGEPTRLLQGRHRDTSS